MSKVLDITRSNVSHGAYLVILDCGHWTKVEKGHGIKVDQELRCNGCSTIAIVNRSPSDPSATPGEPG